MRFIVTVTSRLIVLAIILLFNACSTEETPESPQITSIEPEAGSANSEVTITGSGFGTSVKNMQVKFNGMAAAILSGSNTSLVVRVPNSTTGEVTFQNNVGTATGSVFTYLSADKSLTNFIVPDYTVTISGNQFKINVPALTDVTQLTPSFTISEHATVSPASGTPQDFTNPVQYTVTAEDNSQTVYTVSVKPIYGITNVLLTVTGNIGFNTTIDNSNFLVTGDVSFLTIMSRLPLVYTVTPETGFLITPPNGTTIDVDAPGVIYAKAPNNVVQTYTLQIRNKDSFITGIQLQPTDFSFQGHMAYPEEKTGLSDTDIILRILTTENYTNVVPAAIHSSARSTLVPSASTARDFTNDVTYQVTSETGVQNQFIIRVLRHEILIPNDFKTSGMSIPANGNSFSTTYRSVSDITAAKLIHATTGAEISCTISKSVSGGENRLHVDPSGAFAAGTYKLQVTLANGSVILFRCPFQAS